MASTSQASAVEPLAFTIKQTCLVLGGISRTTLWRLIRSGELKVRRVGLKRILIPRTSIEQFLKKDHPLNGQEK